MIRVLQANGVLVVDTENDMTDYEHLVTAARTAPSLPYGKRLRSRPTRQWWSCQREIYLDEDFAAQVSARPVPVPARVTAYHPVVAAYRADADRHEISHRSLARATRILQALAAEAVRRGYRVFFAAFIGVAIFVATLELTVDTALSLAGLGVTVGGAIGLVVVTIPGFCPD